jgi:hypothetical protein
LAEEANAANATAPTALSSSILTVGSPDGVLVDQQPPAAPDPDNTAD